MIERPILFNEEMLKALLSNKKNQTRRTMKPQLVYGDVCGLFPAWYLPRGKSGGTIWPNGKEQIIATCPYGEVGDRLRVNGGDVLIEITEVRVELLNRISDEDARAEGIIDGGCVTCGNPEPCGCANPLPDARDAFIRLWESIKGPGSWADNPWVWAISFRRVTP